MSGSKPGERRGGRQKGTKNKASIERAQEIAETGETPLDYMIRVMRDRTVDHDRRDKMAASAAPYVHSKLASVEHSGKNGGPIETTNASNRDLARAVLSLLRDGARVEE